MIARFALCALLAAWAGDAGTNQANAIESFGADTFPDAPAWSERGIFVFGGIGLDFKYRLETWVPQFPTVLINCSTPQFYCAWGMILHVALPRTCTDVKIGDTWSANGITTIVLGKMHNPTTDLGIHSYGPDDVYLLGNPAHPDTLYDYWVQSGVRNIYMSAIVDGKPKDIVAMARAGAFDTRTPDVFDESLQTLDSFGPCKPAEKIPAPPP